MKKWIKGGLVASVIYIIIAIFSHPISLETSFLLIKSPILAIFPLIVFIAIDLSRFATNAVLWIINIIIYFIIGALIALIIKKMRSKK